MNKNYIYFNLRSLIAIQNLNKILYLITLKVEEFVKIRYDTTCYIFIAQTRWCQLCGKILKTLHSKGMLLT